jgi:DNA helicase-4
LLLAFGRKAAQEMDERIQERLHTRNIRQNLPCPCVTLSGEQKVPSISKLENDTQARQSLFIKTWQQQCSEKKRRQRLASVAGRRT